MPLPVSTSMGLLDYAGSVVVVGDGIARRGSGRSIASRLAALLSVGRVVPLLPVDLCGDGGLAAAIGRARTIRADDDRPISVVLLGLEDAAEHPSPAWWLSDAHALVERVAEESVRTVVAVPPHVVDGVGDAGPWSDREARRWSTRIPALLLERIQTAAPLVRRPRDRLVVACDLRAMPVEMRADDAWPKDEGLDWIAAEVARAMQAEPSA